MRLSTLGRLVGGMRHPSGALLCTVLAMVSVAHEARAQDVWAVAEREIRRLPPDSFPGLPPRVEQEMRRLDCVVPQGSDFSHPHNVVSGRFSSSDQADWAFLCSHDGTSSIHILWGGSVQCSTPLDGAADHTYLQGLGGDSIGFSRRIMPIDRDGMIRYGRAFNGPPVPVVWHQGIEDYFEGKASRVSLCINGEWIRLSGID